MHYSCTTTTTTTTTLCVLFVAAVLLVGLPQPSYADSDAFDGIVVMRLKYTGETAMHRGSSVVVYGQAQPNTFEALGSGDDFTIHGTYGQNRLLGPIKVTIRYVGHDQAQQVQVIDLQQVLRGAHFGDFVVADVTRHERELSGGLSAFAFPVLSSAGHTKPLLLPLEEPTAMEVAAAAAAECGALNLVIVVDASGSITSTPQGGAPANEDHIRALIKTHVIDELASFGGGAAAKASVVYYGTEAVVTGPFTSDTDELRARVDQIEFFKSAPGWYTNWQAALVAVDELAAAAEAGSLVVLFFTDGNPTVHAGSAYAPADFADDLVAAVHIADHLKERHQAVIVPIGVGARVDASNLVAISGAQPQQDFFLVEQENVWQGAAIELAVRTALSKQLCCAPERDLCGVCGGSGATCLGCDGVYGSGKEYDQCGVCDGDGSLCSEGIIAPCTTEVDVTVESHGWLSLTYNVSSKHLDFLYTDDGAIVSNVVLDFVPFGARAHESSCGASQWTYNVAEREARASFTVDALLDAASCMADPPFTLEDAQVGFQKFKSLRGILYATRTRSHGDYDAKVLSVVQYHFEVRVRNGDVMYAEIHVVPMKIDVRWTGNVDFASGDIAVHVTTRIYTFGRGEHLHLGDSSVLRERETGLVPFHFSPHSEFTPCSFNHESADVLTCEQHWELRTYGAVGVKDFSGHKPLHFTVFAGDQAVSEVLLNLELLIVRHSDPRVDNQLQPWAHAVEQRSVVPAEDNALTMSVGLRNKAFRMVLDKVFYCASRHRDLIPYDVSRPDISGCNTPNTGDISIVLLYDAAAAAAAEKHDPTNAADGFNFTLLSSDDAKTVFRVMERTLGPFKHHLQYHWHAEPVEEDADMGAVEEEMLALLRRWVHHELVHQKLNYATHLFSYARRAYHQPLTTAMARQHKQLYWNAARLHTQSSRALAERHGEQDVRALLDSSGVGDDTGYYHHGGNPSACRLGEDWHGCFYHDAGYYDNDPAYGVGQYNGINAQRCSYGQIWYGGHCTDNTLYAYYGNTYWLIGFVILVGVFGFFYYAVYGDCAGGSLFHTSPAHPHYGSNHHPVGCQCVTCISATTATTTSSSVAVVHQQQPQQTTTAVVVRQRATVAGGPRNVGAVTMPVYYSKSGSSVV